MSPSKDPPPDFSDVKGGASSTAPKPAMPPSGTPSRSHTVSMGESLSKIAKRYYGDANKWRVIYDANRSVVGANPDLIHPGQVLTIPGA